MSGFPANVPAWAALLAAGLVLAGSGLTFIGALGLVRLKTFYERVHAPTLGATLGMFLILGGSVVYFTAAEGRFMPVELLVAVFFTVTTPATLIILARAADRSFWRRGAGAAGGRMRRRGPHPAGPDGY